jgi:hypothetical protein
MANFGGDKLVRKRLFLLQQSMPYSQFAILVFLPPGGIYDLIISLFVASGGYITTLYLVLQPARL